MKVCVFAETLSFDRIIYQALCQRIFKECYSYHAIEFVDHSFEPNGKGQLIKQVPTQIDVQFDLNPDIDLIIIFIDSDNLSPQTQRSQLRRELNDVKFPQGSIIIAAPKRNIESWLISDIEAVNAVSGLSLPEFPKAELIADPKAEFNNIYRSTHNVDIKSVFATNIISKAHIFKLFTHSLAFRTFHEHVRQFIHDKEPSRAHATHIVY